MTIDEVIRRIGRVGIVPVVRAASFDEARRAVEAICAGGISIVEITMTVPEAPAVIREIIREYRSNIVTGAGTVVSAEDAELCLDAGAEFLVSPGVSVPVLRAAHACGKLAIPGALSPTELMGVSAEGAQVVKIFPCGNVGGPGYLKALRAPFPKIKLIPTGGVNLSNAADYIRAGAFAVGMGSELVDVAALRRGDSQKVVETARRLVEAVKQARAGEASVTQPAFTGG